MVRKAIVFDNGQIAVVENVSTIQISHAEPIEEIDLDHVSNSEFFAMNAHPDNYIPATVDGKRVLILKDS